MAIRTDFTINWNASPRVIIIDAPATECTMQDLLDTLRYMEAQPSAMEDSSIVDASGKETLDETTKVGLTISLLNATIGFEARADWTSCQLKGGNLVAFDTDGVTTIDPLYPTAFVNIARTSSSSGTLQEQEALQYSSYQNAVWVDATVLQTGTSFPSGTREVPVNNVQDAVLIGQEKGFSDINFIGNYTLGAGDDVTGFTLVGQNPTRTVLIMGDAATIINVEIKECTLTGTLDGNATVRECVLGNINYFSGYIHHSVLTNATITLGNDTDALFLHCYSGVAGSSTPTINMGGSGQGLGLRNYNGGIKLINRTGTDGISLDMNAGQVVIGSDFTGDPAFIRGSYKIHVEVGGTPPDMEGRVADYNKTAAKQDVYAANVFGALI